MPQVSIVIPAFNAQAFIERTLRSALAQSDVAVEVIVVDDGSTDETAEIVRRQEGVLLVAQTNAGDAAARNAGLKRAGAPFVIFLDHDDLLAPTAARDHLAALTAHPEVDLVAGGKLLIDPSDRIVGENPLAPQRFDYRDLATTVTPTFSQCMYRRSGLARIGDFDRIEGHAADHELNLRLLGKTGYGLCHGRIVASYRLHPGQQTKSPARMYRIHTDILRRMLGPGGPCADRDLLRRALVRSKRYHGQFMLQEAARLLLRRRFAEAGRVLGAYLSALPHSAVGTLRHLRKRVGAG